MKLRQLTATPESRAWLKMAVLTVAVGTTDSLAVWFSAKPLWQAVVIPATLPLLTVALVIIPLMRARKKV